MANLFYYDCVDVSVCEPEEEQERIRKNNEYHSVVGSLAELLASHDIQYVDTRKEYERDSVVVYSKPPGQTVKLRSLHSGIHSSLGIEISGTDVTKLVADLTSLESNGVRR